MNDTDAPYYCGSCKRVHNQARTWQTGRLSKYDLHRQFAATEVAGITHRANCPAGRDSTAHCRCVPWINR